MKKLIFLRLVSIFLAVLVLGSSVGIVINNHYCNSTKTLKQSLFSEKINCDHTHQITHSCEKSCQHDCRHSHEDEICIEKAACCVDYAIFLRLEEVFNNSDSFDQIFNHFFSVLYLFDLSETLFGEASKLDTFVKWYSLPPLLFGKQKVIALSQLKIGNLFL